MEPTQNNQSPMASIKTAFANFDKKQLITPISIIVAGALIAFGLYATGNKGGTGSTNKDLVKGALQKDAPEVPAVTGADHIRGSKDAKIVIVEYSDIECPFCKAYHNTMKSIFNEYSADNEVAWVYRHFPLEGLHKNAIKEAEATECVAELGGEDAFWKFLDELYATTKSNDGLDLSTLPDLGAKIGVDKAKLKACIDSGKYNTKIKESIAAGAKAGAQGTPYTVLMFKGEVIPLVNEQGQGLGALPIDVLKKIIDKMLASK